MKSSTSESKAFQSRSKSDSKFPAGLSPRALGFTVSLKRFLRGVIPKFFLNLESIASFQYAGTCRF